jgi:hypothetical protein
MTTTPSPTPSGLERLLLQIWGPADVGDPTAPAHAFERRPDPCPLCGHDRSTHPVTRDPELGSVSQCPGPDLV